MSPIKKKYLVDEQNRRVAVQLDLETFAEIEELLVEHALAERMTEVEHDDALDLEQAKDFYRHLDKAP